MSQFREAHVQLEHDPAAGIEGITLRPNEGETYMVFTSERTNNGRARITSPLYDVATNAPGRFFTPAGTFTAYLSAVARNASGDRLLLKVPIDGDSVGTPEMAPE